MKRIMQIFLAALSVLAFSTNSGSFAATFPNQTVTIICPYGAGGGTDVILRALSAEAAKFAGVNIVVEDITGGNGATGVVRMMESRPDGYTIGSCSGEWIALKGMGLTPEGFDYNNAEKIMHYNFDPACYLVPTDSPYKTLDDLVKAAKENPGEILLGVTAAGGAHHLTALLFSEMSGAEFNIIPYSEGSSAAITALMSGQVQVGSMCPSEATAQLNAGQVRILGICSANRLPNHPNVPTLRECGYDLLYGSWRALSAPKGTPADVIAKLEDIFLKAAKTKEFTEFCSKNGYVLDILNKADFEKRFIEQEKLINSVCDIYARQKSK